MMRGLQARGVSLSAAMATLAIGAAAILLPASRAALIAPAQAQTEADKRKERERQKARPSKQQDAPSFKAPKPTPKVTAPPQSPGATFQKQLPPSEKPALRKPPPTAKELQKPPLEKPGTKAVRPFQSKPAPDLKKEGIKRPPPGSGQHGVSPPPKGLPPPVFKQQPAPIAKPPSGGPVRVAPKVEPVPPQPGPGIALKRFEDVKKHRLERVEAGGKRKVIEEPGKLFIVKEHGRIVVRHDETERFLRRPGAKLEPPPGRHTETCLRAAATGCASSRWSMPTAGCCAATAATVTGASATSSTTAGFYAGLGVGVGVGALAIIALNLPPPRVTIPRREATSSTTRTPPTTISTRRWMPRSIEDPRPRLFAGGDPRHLRAARPCPLDRHRHHQFRQSAPGRYRRISMTSSRASRAPSSGSWSATQRPSFMIAGHTDAVGSDDDNASLSDRRATAVAEVLTEEFDVPAENLVTQGYGEQYLKIDTQGPEPRNRRVSILNLTRLMAER